LYGVHLSYNHLRVFVASVIPTCPPRLLTNLLLVPRCVSSLVTLPITKVTGVLIFQQIGSLFLVMLCSMRLFFPFPPPASSHSLAPWISF
jgi:hypothetical protein